MKSSDKSVLSSDYCGILYLFMTEENKEKANKLPIKSIAGYN